MILTKAQHHCPLLFVELVKAHEAPDQQYPSQHHAEQRTGESAFSRAAAAATATKQAGKLLLELFKRLIQVRRALIAAAPRVAGAFIAAPRLIP